MAFKSSAAGSDLKYIFPFVARMAQLKMIIAAKCCQSVSNFTIVTMTICSNPRPAKIQSN